MSSEMYPKNAESEGESIKVMVCERSTSRSTDLQVPVFKQCGAQRQTSTCVQRPRTPTVLEIILGHLYK